MPFAKSDLAVFAAARDTDRATVLLAAAHQVRERIRRHRVVQLAGWLVVPGAPRLPGIHADERPLVAREKQDVWRVGIDPKILIVIAARRAAKALPRLASVGRAHDDNAGAVN